MKAAATQHPYRALDLADRAPYGLGMANAPLSLFDQWFEDAKHSEPNDPEAMAVSTVDGDGRPSVRMVLMKGHDERGFVFYTNQRSRKGRALANEPRVAALFHWKTLRRQVRIEGAVSPIEEAEADAYFATRSRQSRLGAWASDQSAELGSRPELETRYAQAVERFKSRDVDRPPHWSGYRIAPDRIEFWSDGAHRLHERRLFTRSGSGWSEGMLYP